MPSVRPRLLIVITLAETGGAQTYVQSLLPALVADYDVTVAAWGPGPLIRATADAGATYVALDHVRRALHPVHDALGMLELIRLMGRVRPHIVHANSSKAGVLARIAATVAHVPVRIFTAHGWAFKADTGIASRAYLWADRAMRPLTTRIVCVAESEQRLGIAARTCTAERSVVIPNAVDVRAVAPGARDGSPPVVVSVGRLKAPKDFATLLQALARLDATSFRAVLVGDGPERSALENEAARLGLGDAVRFAGETDDVAAQLAAADVFVLSSRSEGMPLSIIEAMAAALPVVATNVGGVPELVAHDETGLLVDAGDADGLAAVLETLLADAALRRQLGEAGRARALSRFDLAAFQAAHLELYSAELTAVGLP